MDSLNQKTYDSSNLKSIIGENNLQPVKSGDKDFFRAFGYMHAGCTAIHLGGGYALTAGHCLGGYTYGVEYYENCHSAHSITWGKSTDQVNGYKTSTCAAIIMREFDDEVDYAVLRMHSSPEFHVRPNFTDIPDKGKQVSVFSHPMGRPLEWSGICYVLRANLNTNGLVHSCDTQQGSSGAPILNSQDEIVGIHTHSLLDSNGGTLVSNTAIEELY